MGLTGQGQVFVIIAKMVADIGLNSFYAAVRLFINLVTNIIDNISVAASAVSFLEAPSLSNGHHCRLVASIVAY